MLLNEIEQGTPARPTSRRELRAAEAQLSAAPPVSRAANRVQGPPARPWRRERPLIGGALLVLGGAEIFLSGRFDLGQFRVQLGTDALPSIIVPALLVSLGVAAVLLPRLHAVFGIVALVTALYSLVGVNLGGFLIGMIISSIGGVLVTAWMRPDARSDHPRGDSRARRRTGRKP